MSDALGMRSAAHPLAAPAGWLAASGGSLLFVGAVLGGLFDGAQLVEGQTPWWVLAAEFSAIVLLCSAAFAVAAYRPATAAGLSVMTAALVLPALSGMATLPVVVRVGVLAAAPLVVAGVAHAVLQWSAGTGRSALLRLVYLLAAAAAVIHLVGYDPFFDPACARLCAAVPSLAAGVMDTRIAVTSSAILVLAAAAVAGYAVLRVLGSRIPRSVGGAALAAFVLLGAAWILRVTTFGDPRTATVPAQLSLPFIAGALVGAAVLAAAVKDWRRRTAIARLVASLDQTGRDRLGVARANLQFPVPDDGRWVDVMGRPVDTDGDPGSVIVSDPSGPVARMTLASRRDIRDVFGMLTPSERLRLGNARLAAVTRAHLSDIRASRRRIVTASDAQRRRIERDLHDGVQQRLVSAAFSLGVARGRTAHESSPLADADRAVHGALEHLRRLAHSLYPGLLTARGLVDALDGALHDVTVPTTLEVPSDPEVTEEVAVAIYSAVATILERVAKEPGTRKVAVSIRRTSEAVEVVVALDGTLRPITVHDLVDVADRVGALGGEVATQTTDRGMSVTAVLPCAS